MKHKPLVKHNPIDPRQPHLAASSNKQIPRDVDNFDLRERHAPKTQVWREEVGAIHDAPCCPRVFFPKPIGIAGAAADVNLRRHLGDGTE